MNREALVAAAVGMTVFASMAHGDISRQHAKARKAHAHRIPGQHSRIANAGAAHLVRTAKPASL